MSRRDDRDRHRDFDSRRHRSRFDREPSHKRSRRDGKPETERVSRNGDVGDRIDKDQNKRLRLQDALPLEAATAPNSTAPTGSLNKEPEKKFDEKREGTKHSSEQREGTKHSSEQHEGTKRSSEQREGTKRSSEQREGTKRSSEQREGTKLSSVQREGTKRSSEQHEATKRSSEQREGTKRSSKQREGTKHSSEQREETKLSSVQREGTKRSSEQHEETKRSSEQREGTKRSSEQRDGTKHSSEQREGTKHSSEPTETPRSRPFFQHDERGNSARDGRSYSWRAAPERGRWGNVKDPEFERGTKTSDMRKDERPQFNGDNNGKWRHDKFPEEEHDLPPPPPLLARKRPAFSERKIPVDPENTEKEVNEHEKASRPDRSEPAHERRDDKERNLRHWDKHERVPGADRVGSRDGAQRGLYLSRERNSGGYGVGNYRSQDRFNGRQAYHPSGNRVEKWKHDLFDEANKTTPPRNEEEQIAKLEELLAS